MRKPQLATIYTVLAGLMDASTGLTLMLFPGFTLQIMMIPGELAEPVYMRWIGAFVMSVGLFYLVPFCLKGEQRQRELIAMWRLTAVTRCIICIFVLVQVLLGHLHTTWLTVAVTDGLLAAVQTIMIRGRWLHA